MLDLEGIRTSSLEVVVVGSLVGCMVELVAFQRVGSMGSHVERCLVLVQLEVLVEKKALRDKISILLKHEVEKENSLHRMIDRSIVQVLHLRSLF